MANENNQRRNSPEQGLISGLIVAVVATSLAVPFAYNLGHKDGKIEGDKKIYRESLVPPIEYIDQVSSNKLWVTRRDSSVRTFVRNPAKEVYDSEGNFILGFKGDYVPSENVGMYSLAGKRAKANADRNSQ